MGVSLLFTPYQVTAKPRKKRPAMEDGEEGGERKRGRPKRETEKLPRKKKVKPGEPGYDPYDFTSSEEEEEEEEDTPIGSHDLQQKSYGSQPEEEDMDTGTTTVHISDQRYFSACYTHLESCISHYNPLPLLPLPPTPGLQTSGALWLRPSPLNTLRAWLWNILPHWLTHCMQTHHSPKER